MLTPETWNRPTLNLKTQHSWRPYATASLEAPSRKALAIVAEVRFKVSFVIGTEFKVGLFYMPDEEWQAPAPPETWLVYRWTAEVGRTLTIFNVAEV